MTFHQIKSVSYTCSQRSTYIDLYLQGLLSVRFQKSNMIPGADTAIVKVVISHILHSYDRAILVVTWDLYPVSMKFITKRLKTISIFIFSCQSSSTCEDGLSFQPQSSRNHLFLLDKFIQRQHSVIFNNVAAILIDLQHYSNTILTEGGGWVKASVEVKKWNQLFLEATCL